MLFRYYLLPKLCRYRPIQTRCWPLLYIKSSRLFTRMTITNPRWLWHWRNLRLYVGLSVLRYVLVVFVRLVNNKHIIVLSYSQPIHSSVMIDNKITWLLQCTHNLSLWNLIFCQASSFGKVMSSKLTFVYSKLIVNVSY